jgi:hypothetical protein
MVVSGYAWDLLAEPEQLAVEVEDLQNEVKHLARPGSSRGTHRLLKRYLDRGYLP